MCAVFNLMLNIFYTTDVDKGVRTMCALVLEYLTFVTSRLFTYKSVTTRLFVAITRIDQEMTILPCVFTPYDSIDLVEESIASSFCP